MSRDQVPLITNQMQHFVSAVNNNNDVRTKSYLMWASCLAYLTYLA